MADVVFDPSLIADVNPLDLRADPGDPVTGRLGPDWLDLGDPSKIQSSALKPAGSGAPFVLFIASSTVSSGNLQVNMQLNQDSTQYGDDTGAVFINAAGDGYQVMHNGPELHVKSMTGKVAGSTLAYFGGLTFASDQLFNYFYDFAAETITVSQAGEPMPVLLATDITPIAGMTAGGYIYYGNINVGGIRYIQATAGDPDVPSIVTITDPVTPGGEVELETVNVVVVSVTIGTLETINFVAVDGDNYTFDMPPLAEGLYPQLGSVVVHVLGVDIDDEPVDLTTNIDWELDAAYAAIEIASLSAAFDSIHTVAEDVTIKIGNMWYYKPAEINPFNDTTFNGATTGTTIIWNHDFEDDTLTPIYVVNGVVVPSDEVLSFIEFIQPVGFFG